MVRPAHGRIAALILALVSAASLALMTTSGDAQEGTPTPPPALPIDTSLRLIEAADSNLVAANCTVCHTLAPILTHDGLTPDLWASQVAKMRNDYGATIDDATAEKIVAYLSAHYSAPPPSAEQVLLAPARRQETEQTTAKTIDIPADTTAFASAIVNGGCDTPGASTWELGQTTPFGGANPVVKTPGGPVLAVDTTINTKLDNLVLTGRPQALMVRFGTATDAPFVACGEIVDNETDGQLVVLLQEQGNSGLGGLATLVAREEGFAGLGGEAVEVQVLLVRGAFAGGSSTPAPAIATPTAAPVAALPAVGACEDGSTGNCLPVGMRDIYFSPNMLSAPAGGATAFNVVNQGQIGHNFSIDAHGNSGLKNLGVSVNLDPDGKQTVSVDAPAGDYYFYCDIPGHEAAGMRGYLNVAENVDLSATEAPQTPPER